MQIRDTFEQISIRVIFTVLHADAAVVLCMLIISCGSGGEGSVTGRDCRTDGLVCVHNFVLWFFSYETEIVQHTHTRRHTHTQKLVCSTCVIHNKSLKRRQRSDCGCCCFCCCCCVVVVAAAVLLFVLLAGIFTQLFYMLRLQKSKNKKKNKNKSSAKKLLATGIEEYRDGEGSVEWSEVE